MTPAPPDLAALSCFWDVLLPGDAGWPAASTAITDPVAAWTMVAEADQAWLCDAARRVAAVAPDGRVAAMQALQQEAPDGFGRVLAALYAAYYNTAAAHEQVRRLAEAGPQEASPHFDTSLLRQVIATQAGRRRI